MPLETSTEAPVRVSCVAAPYKSTAIIEALMRRNPAIGRIGFRAAMRTLLPADRPEAAESLGGFLADGYLILPDAKEVHLIEIVDTCPISFDKAHLIDQFGETIDEFGWRTSVAIFDYAGTFTGHAYYLAFNRHHLKRWAGQNLRDAVPAVLATQRDLGWPVSLAGVTFESVIL